MDVVVDMDGMVQVNRIDEVDTMDWEDRVD